MSPRALIAIGVFQASPNAETAAEFLAFMTNPENSAKLAQFFPPPRESLLTAEVLAATNPLLSEEPHHPDAVRRLEHAMPFPLEQRGHQRTKALVVLRDENRDPLVFCHAADI
jgi:ABC-type glycerol-3-phosphate transport system substrate-binding protein